MGSEKKKRKNYNRTDGLDEAQLQAHREKNRLYKQQSRSRLKEVVQASRSATPRTDSTSVRVGAASNDERVTGMLARDCAMHIKTALIGYDLVKQTRVLEKMIYHPVLKSVLPDYLQNISEIKQNHILLSNFKEGVTTNVSVESKSKRAVAAKHMLCHLATTSSLGSQRGASKVLGIDRRNIMLVLSIRILDSSAEAFWNPPKRATRSDALAVEVRVLVIECWTTETTVSPNRKQIRRLHIGVKLYEKHATHFLEESQLDFFTRFKQQYPEIKIMLTAFSNLKPYFVKRLTEWNTCVCRYHSEMEELRVGINAMRAKGQGIHNDCHCVCEICRPPGTPDDVIGCQAFTCTYNRLSNLWCSVLCAKPLYSEFHRRECLLGACPNCGAHTLKVCPRELSETNVVVQWRKLKKVVVGKDANGVDKKASRLEYVQSSPLELLDYLRASLPEFIKHNWISKWQAQEFKSFLKNFPSNTIVSCVDFSENYAFKMQNEVQDMHWYNFQVSILLHITYRQNPAYNTSDPSTRLLKEVHYYISDDKQHDTLFVQHCFRLHWQYLQIENCFPERHVVWSDGCSGQFKSARAWYFISRYPQITMCPELQGGMSMTWNYFASGHGKGEVDGCGALLKWEIRKEQVKPNATRIQNAHDVVLYMQSQSAKVHAAHPNVRKEVNLHFWEVKVDDVDRSLSYDCSTVAGSRSMHQAKSVSCQDVTLLQYRQLSCFCLACEGVVEEECEESAHVPGLCLKKLQPTVCLEARRLLMDQEDEIEYGEDGEVLAEVVRIGDNVAVPAHSESGEFFWLFQCDKPIHEVARTFQDRFGNTYLTGEFVIRGHWYEILQNGSRTYYLDDNVGPDYIYSHLVKVAKFGMLPTRHRCRGSRPTYELSEETLQTINSVFEHPHD